MGVFNVITIAQLPFAFLTQAKDANRPAVGVILLRSPIGDDGFVQRTLQERQNRIEGMFAAAERRENPNVATQMYRRCARRCRKYISGTTPQRQTLPFLSAFEAQQLRLVNKLPPAFSPLPEASLFHATLKLEDGGLGNVPASVVSEAALVGSRLDIAPGVVALPGESSLLEIDLPLPTLLVDCYAQNQVPPLGSPQLPTLSGTPGNTQNTIIRGIQTCRAATF